ncbi:hypothetical protein [Halogranum amylolyticum]|uniref:hypothetical protein n=1 Tax=Halogranum amylolyticum TaxID=660520 RepID=UPI000ADADD55|nr:hypothetical protein [Halogranum amylolyticum]
MSSTNERTPTDRPPKTVLICPSCGHESPLSGDWKLETREDEFGTSTAYVCPRCASVVTRRPVS